jgi:tripeptidyl-peptidase-1
LVNCANTSSLPHVFSASYTDFEGKVAPDYASRTNTELMKIAVRGTSLLMAAGDYGVGTLYSESAGYQPEFPASSPWVTSVGGTMFGDQKTNPLVEEVWNDDAFGTGGGFSNLFESPPYQQAAVAAWYNLTASEQKLPANASWWNSTGRAYPDVAALATPYQTVCSGFVQIGTGTSASTPTMAGIVSLLNEHRLAAGKPVLGFLNPLIYKLLGPRHAFRDVVLGSSPGFYDHGGGHRLAGFYAVDGFDPTTGWGTPNFPALLQEVMKLP